MSAQWAVDPENGAQLRWFDGHQWTEHTAPRGPQQAIQPQWQPVPARTAHGCLYWVTVGWFIQPTLWVGRTSLWLFAWPLGLWRSIAHGRSKDRRRVRRGAQQGGR